MENEKIEPPFFDKNGKEIREFDLIKMFHFTGVNSVGRGRKKYYMYKWVGVIDYMGKLCWVAYHLDKDTFKNKEGSGENKKGSKTMKKQTVIFLFMLLALVILCVCFDSYCRLPEDWMILFFPWIIISIVGLVLCAVFGDDPDPPSSGGHQKIEQDDDRDYNTYI